MRLRLAVFLFVALSACSGHSSAATDAGKKLPASRGVKSKQNKDAGSSSSGSAGADALAAGVCRSVRDCDAEPARPICDLGQGICVECTVDSDCDDGVHCVRHKCSATSTSASGCDAASACDARDAGHSKQPTDAGGPASMKEAGKASTSDAASDAGKAQDACADRVPDLVAGNLLIIFDQSLSMLDKWGNTDKLTAAIDAVTSMVERFKDSLTVGAILVPVVNSNSSSSNCLVETSGSFVEPIDGIGNIPLVNGAQFLEQFKAHWTATDANNGFGTPLNEAFDRADVALRAALPSLHGRTAVLVFTDGMPNCTPDPKVTGIPTKTEPVRAADWLSQENVATYVFGLPGADGVTYLSDIARNGGTGGAVTTSDADMFATQLAERVQAEVLQSPVSSPDAGCK